MESKKLIAICSFCVTSLGFYGQSQLTVQPGTELKPSANTYIVLENTHLVNNGVINLNSLNGTFKFSGTINTNISGSSTTYFNHVELSKTGVSQVVLQTNAYATGNVIFTSGLLHLNNQILNLDNAGMLINENENSHVIGPTGGYIERSVVLNAPSSVNPGNLGAILTTSQNMGNTIIRRGHVSQTNGSGGGSSILRYFDITPTNNTALNATLRFTYLDAELNSLPEPALTIWKSANLTSWVNMGFDSRNTTTNYVEKNGLADFSRWTLTIPGNPLPVRFNVFNGNCNGNNVILKWTTAMEINTGHFEIQKSSDGRTWTSIGTVAAAGNSPVEQQYSFTDHAATQNSFYRIAELDQTGQLYYSMVNRVKCGGERQFALWPNPMEGQAWLSIDVAMQGPASLKVFDTKGTLVLAKPVQLFAGTNVVSVDGSLLAAGQYVLQLKMKDEVKNIQFIKQ